MFVPTLAYAGRCGIILSRFRLRGQLKYLPALEMSIEMRIEMSKERKVWHYEKGSTSLT